MTARPTPSQTSVIRYFRDGAKSTVRWNQATSAACEREGWIARIEAFPFHRATDAGLRACGLELPVHLHTGVAVDGTARCGEQVTDRTSTAATIGEVTCTTCIAEYNAYAASLTGELAKFSRREAPYDQDAPADPKADARLRRQLGVDAAAVLEHLDPAPAVKLTQARPADPAPTSVRVDGRTVVLADASLVELACIHGDARARAQHLNPHEGRRYFRARDEADAALAEIRRRVDTLYRARAAAGEGSGLDDVLAVIDAADRRPAAGD